MIKLSLISAKINNIWNVPVHHQASAPDYGTVRQCLCPSILASPQYWNNPSRHI